MSKVNQRKELQIPPSYDVGVHFYYRNLLSGSEYVQAYVREYIAAFDAPHTKLFESANSGSIIDSSDRRQMPYESLVAVLEDAGVDSKSIEQIKYHISHLAGGLGKPMDYLRVREFLAFAGIEGIYDLDAKKHIKQERKVLRIPPTIVPERWRALPNVEEVRQDIAFMMDETNRIPELDAKIASLNMTVWGEFVVAVTKDVQRTPVPENLEPLREKYLAERPHLVRLNDELKGLKTLRESTISEMKDRFAPMDPDFKLPKTGNEFDKSWFDKGESLINQQRPFRQKFDKYMAGIGHKKGDPEYDSFDWQNLRSRAFAIWDWTYRDYTASPANRGILADARKGDFEKGFVKAVKDELSDGLLGILDLPYKIEAIDGKSDEYAIVCNDHVTETFTLKQVYDLETEVIAKAEKEASDPKGRSRKKPAPKPAIQPAAKAEKPAKSAQQKAEEKLAREKRLFASLVAAGVDPNDITVHDAKGAKSSVIESMSAGAASTPENETTEDTMAPTPTKTPQDAAEVAQPIEASPISNQPEKAITEPVKADAATTDIEEEEELLFPGEGVAGEGGLDINGNKIGDKAKDPDDVVVSFGRVAPDHGINAPETPVLASDKPATPNEASSRTPGPSDEPRSDKMTLSVDERKKQSPYPDRPKYEGGPQRDNRQPNPHYTGNGMGMGGMGGMGQRGFNPQSLTVDLGIGHMVRSITNLGSSVRAALRPAGQNVFEATEALNASVEKISKTRSTLSAGVDAAGVPLTDAAKIEQWTQLNADLKALDSQTKTLRKVPGGAMEDETLKSFKNAAKELSATKDLAKAESQSPGKLGELAKEAQKAAEHIAQVMMNIIKAIMNVFSRNKSPSL